MSDPGKFRGIETQDSAISVKISYAACSAKSMSIAPNHTEVFRIKKIIPAELIFSFYFPTTAAVHLFFQIYPIATVFLSHSHFILTNTVKFYMKYPVNSNFFLHTSTSPDFLVKEQSMEFFLFRFLYIHPYIYCSRNSELSIILYHPHNMLKIKVWLFNDCLISISDKFFSRRRNAQQRARYYLQLVQYA